MPLALLTLTLEDADADRSSVSVYVSAGTGDTAESLSEDYAHVFWNVVRPLVDGILVDVNIALRPDFSAWDNNTLNVLSDIEEKVIFSLQVCGQNRPVRLTLPTVKEAIFENSGTGKFADFTNADVAMFGQVLGDGVVDDGIGAVDSHGNDICGILFGEQFFGKG